jgi:hypothetical protein
MAGVLEANTPAKEEDPALAPSRRCRLWKWISGQSIAGGGFRFVCVASTTHETPAEAFPGPTAGVAFREHRIAERASQPPD